MKVGMYGLGLALIVASVGTSISATATATVPEIDGASLSAGLGLLTGSLLILRARWRSR